MIRLKLLVTIFAGLAGLIVTSTPIVSNADGIFSNPFKKDGFLYYPFNNLEHPTELVVGPNAFQVIKTKKDYCPVADPKLKIKPELDGPLVIPADVPPNTFEDNLALQRLLFRYRQLWNMYVNRNTEMLGHPRPKTRSYAARALYLMNSIQPPCMFHDQPASIVRARLSVHVKELLSLLTYELTTTTVPRMVEAQRDYVKNYIVLEITNPTFDRYSVKDFKDEFARAWPTIPDAAPESEEPATNAEGQPVIMEITRSRQQ